MDRCCCETFGKRGRCIAGSLIGGECDFGGSPVINRDYILKLTGIKIPDDIQALEVSMKYLAKFVVTN